MSSGGWAMPTLRCPSLPEAARERRERLSHPLGRLLSERSGRTSAEPEVSGTGRLVPEIVAMEAGADPEVRAPLPSPPR